MESLYFLDFDAPTPRISRGFATPQTTHIASFEARKSGYTPGRRIWTKHYDKRFCFDDAAARARIGYVERHNERMGWPAKPWPFITPFTPLEQNPI